MPPPAPPPKFSFTHSSLAPPTRKLAARSLASVLLVPVLVLLEGVTRSFLEQRLVSESTETGRPNRSFRNRMKCCIYIYIYISAYLSYSYGWLGKPPSTYAITFLLFGSVFGLMYNSLPAFDAVRESKIWLFIKQCMIWRIRFRLITPSGTLIL